MLKILIVDDITPIRMKIRTYLENLGHKVVGEARNGKEAVEMYKKYKPDLITLDINMPVMNGLATLRKLMDLSDKQAKIIISTSNTEDKIVIDAIKTGAKGYILKPITEERLYESILRIFPNYVNEKFYKNDNILEDEDLEDF